VLIIRRSAEESQRAGKAKAPGSSPPGLSNSVNPKYDLPSSLVVTPTDQIVKDNEQDNEHHIPKEK